MANDTDAAAGRLLHQLLAGQRPDAAPLDEVAEVLAGGVPDDKRTEAVVDVLLKLYADGRLNLVDTGKKTYSPNLFQMWSFPRSSENSRQRAAEDQRYGGRSSCSVSSPMLAVIGHPVYRLQRSELLKVKDILSGRQEALFPGGLWPARADQWCGVEAVEADRELTSGELKAELLGRSGTVHKAGGKVMLWNSLLENSALVSAAKVKDPATGDFKKSAKESVWNAEKFKTALAGLPYTVHKAPADGAAVALKSMSPPAVTPKAFDPFSALRGGAGRKP